VERCRHSGVDVCKLAASNERRGSRIGRSSNVSGRPAVRPLTRIVIGPSTAEVIVVLKLPEKIKQNVAYTDTRRAYLAVYRLPRIVIGEASTAEVIVVLTRLQNDRN